MNEEQTGNKLIVYRSGGLGDFVKTWGFLRDNPDAIIVTKKDRGGLLHRTLGHAVLGDDDWQSFFRNKSYPPSFVSACTHIIVYRHEYFAESDEQIRSGLKSMNPDAKVELRNFSPACCEGTNPEPRTNAGGDIIFHIGTGELKFSKSQTADYHKRGVFPIKAWDIERSFEFSRLMKDRGYPIDLIAGPIQRDQWDRDMLQAFEAANGSFSKGEKLTELTDLISESKCFIGFDSGPTHLAAQLGVPTVGMYGPTGKNGVDLNSHDLLHAEPLGPREHLCLIHPGASILDSAKPRMEWLTPLKAADIVQAFLDQIYKQTN